MGDFITDNLGKIIIGVIAFVIILTIYSAWYEQTHCIKWRVEKQFEPPMYMQPGKDGGIAIPLSNGKWKDVKVCDEFRK